MIKIDDIDIEILSELQHNGRLTKLKLAERVNLSASACHERISRLERSGVIASYHAEIDLTQIIKLDVIFVEVTLANHKPENLRVFEASIAEVDEIVECLAVGGGFDYLLRFVTENIASYQILLEQLLDANIGIERYFTYIVTKEIKRYDGLPLRNLTSLRK